MINYFAKIFKLPQIAILNLIFINFGCSSPLKIDSHSDTFNTDLFNYLYENRQSLNLCEGEIDLEVAQQNFKIYPLENKIHLIEFLCFLGAYQGNYQYLIYQEKPQQTLIKLLSFDIFQESKTQEITQTQVTALTGIPHYNPQTKDLEILTKYRGLADCGAFAKYQWDKAQLNLNLREYRLKSQCDGQYINPENYALVYPQ